MLAPEERRRRERRSLAHEIERGDLALTFRDHPMLDPNCFAADRIGPARDIARGEYARRARLEIGVDNDAPIHFEAGRFGKPDTRAHAKTRDDEIGLDRGSIRQTDLPPLDPDRSGAEMEADAMLLMQRANELPHVMAEDALHRNRLRRGDMDLDLARPQRRCNLKPDEARAEHQGRLCGLGPLDDRPAIGERAQDEYLRGRRSRN